MMLTIGNSGKTLRAVVDSDHAELAAWIAADPDHRELTTVEFFSMPADGEESYVVEDELGTVFYLKLTRAVRVDIQFPPGQDRKTKARIREALIDGFGWLAGVLETRMFRQIIFASKNDVLVRSLEKRLGFRKSPSELLREIFPKKEG